MCFLLLMSLIVTGNNDKETLLVRPPGNVLSKHSVNHGPNSGNQRNEDIGFITAHLKCVWVKAGLCSFSSVDARSYPQINETGKLSHEGGGHLRSLDLCCQQEVFPRGRLRSRQAATSAGSCLVVKLHRRSQTLQATGTVQHPLPGQKGLPQALNSSAISGVVRRCILLGLQGATALLLMLENPTSRFLSAKVC